MSKCLRAYAIAIFLSFFWMGPFPIADRQAEIGVAYFLKHFGLPERAANMGVSHVGGRRHQLGVVYPRIFLLEIGQQRNRKALLAFKS